MPGVEQTDARRRAVMERLAGKREEGAEDWVPAALSVPTIDKAPNGGSWTLPEARVAHRSTARNGAKNRHNGAEAPRNGAEAPSNGAEAPRNGAAEQPDPEIERLRAELRDTEKRASVAEWLREDLENAEKRARAAEQRAERAEQALKRRPPTAVAKPRARGAAPKSRKPPRKRASKNGGEPNLNEITFEGLRALGLSVNQAARFIGQREQHGGLKSMTDVDGVVGLPREVKDRLKQQGKV